MSYAFIILSLLATSISFAAEKAVIQQMKGRRAIVHFEKDIPFSVGQKIYLNSEDGVELGVQKEMRNPLERKNSVSFAAGFSSAETTTKAVGTSKTSTTSYVISGRYGWNKENYEYGPLGSFSFSKTSGSGSSETNTYQFGGFFDYNLIPNKPGEDTVWGFFGEGAFGNTKSNGLGATIITATGGGFIKWFVFSPMLAIRSNLYYSLDLTDFASGTTKSRNTGTLGASFALSHYF